MTKTQAIVTAAVGVALIAAYVAVTVTGHDGNGVLGVLVGWLGGASVHPVTQAVAK